MTISPNKRPLQVMSPINEVDELRWHKRQKMLYPLFILLMLAPFSLVI
jgi:hypothetical protein